jgi:acetylglutamate kinase
MRTRRDPESRIEELLDLGFVGQPSRIRKEVLTAFERTQIVPVIAPIGWGADGQTYNINADTAAGAIAGALRAHKLILLTDVDGVLDADGHLISELSAAGAREMLTSGAASGGMIPKLETCLEALQSGVGAVHVLDGRLPHVLLLETFTEAGVGTKINP